MTIDRYDLDGFAINLYLDEQQDWLAHLQEIPNISAFGDTPQAAIEELKLAWELVKEDYREKGSSSCSTSANSGARSRSSIESSTMTF